MTDVKGTQCKFLQTDTKGIGVLSTCLGIIFIALGVSGTGAGIALLAPVTPGIAT